jgi:hypothetical protein
MKEYPAVFQHIQLPVHACKWKEAVIDESMVIWSYRKEHESDPRLALHESICAEINLALDPAVSERAHKLLEEGFKAGYHCQWIRSEMRYIFDPAIKPGDPDGAFKAWLNWRRLQEEMNG